MNDKIIQEALNTGTRNDLRWYFKELILLYEDGTWEKIFRSNSRCNVACIGVEHLRGRTRSQVVDKLQNLVQSGKLIGEFISKAEG